MCYSWWIIINVPIGFIYFIVWVSLGLQGLLVTLASIPTVVGFILLVMVGIAYFAVGLLGGVAIVVLVVLYPFALALVVGYNVLSIPLSILGMLLAPLLILIIGLLGQYLAFQLVLY